MAVTSRVNPTPTPALNVWWVRLPLLALLGGVFTVMALMLVLLTYQIGIAGRVVPGVFAGGVALGGMTRDEAILALQDAFTYDDNTVFTLRLDEQFWQVSAADLGVSLDAPAMVEAALALGHGGNPAQNLLTQAQIWLRGGVVAPMVRYDEARAQAQLEQIAQAVNVAPQNATLRLDGINVLSEAGSPGRTLDIDTALSQLQAQILALQPGGEIALSVTEYAPALASLDDTSAYLSVALSAPIALTATDAQGQPLGPWMLSPEQIAPLLRAEPDAQGQYQISVDLAPLAAELERLAPGLIVPAQNGMFTFNDETRELEAIVPAVHGRQLDVPETLRRMEAAVFDAQNRTVEIAFSEKLPIYHNNITAAELGITELVSSSRTFYTGSTANRRKNIEVGATFYNGLIVAPGETFSFNAIIGDISAERGFVEGAIIFGGRTVTGIGGGVCQVSTTVYRAAFFGGYPIVERYSHGYRVGYYELGGAGPGLDAAIFTPTADFKFVNDTDYHLLIETEFMPEADAIEFRFYSTNPGRTVEVSQPILRNETQPLNPQYEVNPNLQPGQQLQVDWAQSGGDVIITRVIRDLQGNILERRDYGTFYQPWGAIVQVAPGDPRLTASSS